MDIHVSSLCIFQFSSTTAPPPRQLKQNLELMLIGWFSNIGHPIIYIYDHMWNVIFRQKHTFCTWTSNEYSYAVWYTSTCNQLCSFKEENIHIGIELVVFVSIFLYNHNWGQLLVSCLNQWRIINKPQYHKIWLEFCNLAIFSFVKKLIIALQKKPKVKLLEYTTATHWMSILSQPLKKKYLHVSNVQLLSYL
jgi:hypothetical protein